MAIISIQSDHQIQDGEQFTFRAAAAAANVTGLRIYYPMEDSVQKTSKTFAFRDIRGNALTSMDIFATDAYVTVSIDTTNNHAYVLNYSGATEDLSNVLMDKSVSIGSWRRATWSGEWDDKNIRCSAYGKGKFIFLSNTTAGRAYFSRDCTNWWYSTMPVDSGGWNALSYGEKAGIFLAAKTGAADIAISFDGMRWFSPSWNTNAAPTSAQWIASAWNDGNKCVITAGRITDMTTTPYTVSKSNVVGVVQFPYAGSPSYYAVWAKYTMPSSQVWHGLAFGGGYFVAVAATGGVAAYSSNGSSWTEVSMPSNTLWYSVAYGKGRFVAVSFGDTAAPGSTSKKVAVSTNHGQTWTEVEMPQAGKWQEVIFTGERFFAVSSTGLIAYSYDGLDWTVVASSSEDNVFVTVACGGGRLMVKTSNGDVAYADLEYESPFLTQLEEAMAANPGKWKKALGLL